MKCKMIDKCNKNIKSVYQMEVAITAGNLQDLFIRIDTEIKELKKTISEIRDTRLDFEVNNIDRKLKSVLKDVSLNFITLSNLIDSLDCICSEGIKDEKKKD